MSFIVGIAVSNNQNLSLWQSSGVIACLILGFLSFFIRKNYRSITVCLLFFLLGALHNTTFSSTPSSQNHIWNQIDSPREAVVVGTLATMVSFDGTSSRAEIDTLFIRFADPAKLTPIQGKLSLYLHGIWPKKLVPGTTLAIRVKLKRPTSFKAQGVFDYTQFLAQKNIWITGTIASPFFIHNVEIDTPFYHSLLYTPEKLRSWIGYKIDQAVPDTAGLYRAILLGDKSQLNDNLLEDFKACGLMHILAISGLHIAVIATFFYTTLFFLLRCSTYLMLHYNIRKIAAVLCLPPVLFYSLLTGGNTPVVRALLMAVIVLVALCINRRKSPAPLLGLAAFLILAYNPQQLFTASFQLSFTAMVGILFFLPRLKYILEIKENPHNKKIDATSARTNKLARVVWAAFLLSLVATMATLPILLYNFNRVSLIGSVVNLVIEPLICLWSLPLGIIALPFLQIAPSLGEWILYLGSFGLSSSTYICHHLSELPFAQIWLPTPSKWLIGIYYIGVVLLLRKRNSRGFILGSILVVISLWLFIYSPQSLTKSWQGKTVVSFIDVGQGSSTLIEFAGGYRVLIDGGGSSYSNETVGSKVLGPLLWKKGINKLDAVFITHADGDHYNGIPFLLAHFPIREIIVASKEGHSSSLNEMLKRAARLGSNIHIAKESDVFHYGTATIQCLYNFTTKKNAATRAEENRGILLKAKTQGVSFLFPGDIDVIAEQELLQLDIQADILLSPHHGSLTSNSESFLKTVQPETVIVSAGMGQKKSFPHPIVEERIQQLHIPLLTTRDDGTIEIIPYKNDYLCVGLEKRNGNPLQNYVKKELTCQNDYSTSDSSR